MYRQFVKVAGKSAVIRQIQGGVALAVPESDLLARCAAWDGTVFDRHRSLWRSDSEHE